ncbi:MAG: hypothetical protein OEV74_15335 [Cyclobacteriaceae bacterium]|jgi:hypothetical protein|nr:hypothetical protein [Cyclobacteriaceae bacterium]MDH4297650.1 hypothetical protein [Cyclobacteriaceae bacterium]MDH5248239.1 hypothetical protein [Cyclobacteriaceae bacterium]
MKASGQNLPYKISEYIQSKFREDFLFEVKQVRPIGGQLMYTVEVSKDGYIYTLNFNVEGDLIAEEAAQAFPPDSHDENTYGDLTA